jgi:redox-sensitive bicupin YhaK (pirin superfamily)
LSQEQRYQISALKRNGIIDGFQLWVNLPTVQKMSHPRYQEVGVETIPVFEKKGCRVRVVAGTVGILRGPLSEIASNPVYLDGPLEAGAIFSPPVPKGHTVLAYVFEGQGMFGSTEVASVKMVVFAEGNHFEARVSESPVRFILMAGAPFGEPIVLYGPFVMSTCKEIQQALADLRDGTFIRE